MKKVLFVMVAAAALTITSCCNNKAKTCDKANTECVAVDSCCKAACEMADSCCVADSCATCEKADSCTKVCPKATCEKACNKN